MRGLYMGGGNEFVTFAEAQRRLGGSQHKGLSEHIATRDRSPDFNYLGSFLPNPDAILKRMGKDVEVYRQLRADAHTGGCIRRRKAAVKSLEWRINRDKAGARVTRIVEDVFSRLDLDTLINEMLDAVLYGFQPLEVMWARGKGGAPQPWDIVGKPPEWFLFDTDAELRFRSRAKWTEGEPLAARKFLLAQQEATYANPYGFADLSMCFWPVTFKKGGLRYWVKFAEKYGMPWAVGKQPRNSPQAETNKLLDQLEAMIEDAVAVIPDDASVEMLQAAGANGNADAYERLLMFCRSEVAIALLGQNQSTEASSTHASAAAGLEVTADIRDGDKGLVEAVLNKQLIRWIVDLNDGPDAPAPEFELYEAEEVSKTLAERDEILARAGLVFTPHYFKRVYGLEDDDIAGVGGHKDAAGAPVVADLTGTGGPDAQPLGEGAPAAVPGAAFAEGGDGAAELEQLAALMGPASAEVLADWKARIDELVANAKTAGDLERLILGAFDGLPEDELVAVMRLALTAARLGGMGDVAAEAV